MTRPREGRTGRPPRPAGQQAATATRPRRSLSYAEYLRRPVGRVPQPVRQPPRHPRETPQPRRTLTPNRKAAPARSAKPKPEAKSTPKLRVVAPPWTPSPAVTRRRLLALLVVLLLLFVGVGVRLVDLQAVGRERYSALGANQRVRTIPLPAERGSIFDRSGQDLAVSVPHQTVWADPRVIPDPAGYAAQLTPIVGADEAKLRDALSQRDKAFVYVARKVDDATVAEVKRLKLPGVDFVPESKREYPNGTLAGPLLGFVGTDNTGLGGLETQFEGQLTGHPGELVVELDPQGRELPDGEQQVEPARRGSDLVLTIDDSLQYSVEQALVEGVTEAKASGGTSIVMDVQTGDILAMASVDGATRDRKAQPAGPDALNRAVTHVYPPGSTNKVITVAGALEDGAATPDSWFDTPQSMSIGGTEYRDEGESHPAAMTVADIVRNSSNTGTIQIARRLGEERFDAYLRAFGFGARTSLQFPGESNGTILPLAEYSDTSMASMPTGNGIAVTAMQMLDVFTTIANGGSTRPPRLVAATIDPDGVRHDQPPLASERVVSPETAAAVRAMLETVVQSGTGKKAAIEGFRVAGKTGTARKPPYTGEYVASFAGFAPADAPRLAAIVVIDEPQTEYYAGQVAAPLFARIMELALHLEQVPPSGGPVP